MDDIIVSVQNLSKVYTLYDKPQDRLKKMLFEHFGKHYGHPFWALRDISFEARRGQAIGILGRNGAGKTTLLQVIAGTLQPSSGAVTVKGRISALLELGSGFNPEYTGRENIFMNGAILGFNHKEMASRFDEIVAFADIGEFIEQPVKIYSSGMYARLAFSVAVMVEPEVLIIDEILSVGDARFARKSFARMEEFRKTGHTILLVSHDINTINFFCDYAILLSEGQIVERGEPKHVTNIYYKMLFGSDTDNKPESKLQDELTAKGRIDISFSDKEDTQTKVTTLSPDIDESKMQDELTAEGRVDLSFSDREDTQSKITTDSQNTDEAKIIKKLAAEKLAEAINHGVKDVLTYGNKLAQIIDFGILNRHGERVTILNTGEEYTIFSTVLFMEEIAGAHLGYQIRTTKGIAVFGVNTHIAKIFPSPHKKGDIVEGRVVVKMRLAPNDYFLTFGCWGLHASSHYDRKVDALGFHVIGDCVLLADESLVNMEAKISIRDMVSEV